MRFKVGDKLRHKKRHQITAYVIGAYDSQYVLRFSEYDSGTFQRKGIENDYEFLGLQKTDCPHTLISGFIGDVKYCCECNASESQVKTDFALRAQVIKTLNMTLPTDSKERKEYPLLRGCLRYFPAALAGVAKVSKEGNDKHNPGEELHHARGKSTDHADCIVRHLMDVQDLLAIKDRGDAEGPTEAILREASQLAWRALAYSQELHESFGAPLAPGAKKEEESTR